MRMGTGAFLDCCSVASNPEGFLQARADVQSAWLLAVCPKKCSMQAARAFLGSAAAEVVLVHNQNGLKLISITWKLSRSVHKKTQYFKKEKLMWQGRPERRESCQEKDLTLSPLSLQNHSFHHSCDHTTTVSVQLHKSVVRLKIWREDLITGSASWGQWWRLTSLGTAWWLQWNRALYRRA